MQIYLSLLVAGIGVLMYFFCASPKLQEIGRIMFAFGLLSFLLKQSDQIFQLISK